MSQYIISPEAIRDLDEIADYFVARNVEAGERFIDEFTKKCRYLIEFSRYGTQL